MHCNGLFIYIRLSCLGLLKPRSELSRCVNTEASSLDAANRIKGIIAASFVIYFEIPLYSSRGCDKQTTKCYYLY